MLTFQEIIFRLQQFWMDQGCLLQQGYNLESGAGTFNPETFLRCIGPEPYKMCNVEICKRPTDGRYGENPNRLQRFHQFQVILKPSPLDSQNLYLQSLEALGLNLSEHDIRFVHDDWASPTQGAWGLGWEIWCDGMEITQYTYFQSVGGIDVRPVVVEYAYGLERLAMFLQGVSNVYDIKYNDTLTYGDVFLQNEITACQYNFEDADVTMLRRHFDDFEREGKRLIELKRVNSAYEFAIKASHVFNLLEARSAISVTARVDLMHRIKALSCASAKLYLDERENLDFPLLKKDPLPLSTFTPPAKKEIPYSTQKVQDLLLEIGSEEIPASFMPAAMLHLEKALPKALSEYGLTFSHVEVYGATRRLAIHIFSIPEGIPPQKVEKKGPPLSTLFDNEGNPTKQAVGFFQSIPISPPTRQEIEEGRIPSLSILEDKYLVVFSEKKGLSTFSILQELLPKIIQEIPFPKKMRWATFDTTYARPLRWILALYGSNVVPFAIDTIASSNLSYGHGQLYPYPVKIRAPKKYLTKLRRCKVLACALERRKFLEKQLHKWEWKLEASILHKEKVLSEVLFLSEYPQVASASFHKRFLTLPQELLSSEMIDHQRYFPLQNKDGSFSSTFLLAIDRNPNEIILRNNEAVLTARLSDGFFLYELDTKQPLDYYNKALEAINFHPELGSLFEKTKRLLKLSETLGFLLGFSAPSKAALLAKADLATQVVYQFPELQGTMGKYYALKSGETEETAFAIEEQYLPLTEGGKIPDTTSGAILALADKLDNLISYFSVGIKPSSSKDPYALRRAAIGILRILIEKKWFLDLSKIVANADLLTFLKQRIKAILLDNGFEKEEIDAILSIPSYDPYDIYCRTEALHAFREKSKAFDHLLEVYKRVHGQTSAFEKKNFSLSLLEEPGEKELSTALITVKGTLEIALTKKDYLTAFQTLSTLHSPLSYFFDTVRVLTPDAALQENRIALLQELSDITKGLVDFTSCNTSDKKS
jgi:glycyl-tRNA synthetase